MLLTRFCLRVETCPSTRLSLNFGYPLYQLRYLALSECREVLSRLQAHKPSFCAAQNSSGKLFSKSKTPFLRVFFVTKNTVLSLLAICCAVQWTTSTNGHDRWLTSTLAYYQPPHFHDRCRRRVGGPVARESVYHQPPSKSGCSTVIWKSEWAADASHPLSLRFTLRVPR